MQRAEYVAVGAIYRGVLYLNSSSGPGYGMQNPNLVLIISPFFNADGTEFFRLYNQTVVILL